jgi:TonB-linked SusC/RagA family outer membrane protein
MIKFAVLFLFIFSLQSFGRGYSQETITLRLNNVSIRQVLKAIEAQASYRFVFKESILQRGQKVTVEVQNASLEETLDQVLNSTSLTYRQLNKKLVVISIGEAEKEKVPFELPVSGKVTNSSGEPLTGASITVKNTNLGTTTDAAGNFSLTVPDKNSVLVISFVGYAAQEIIVGSTSDFNIRLNNSNLSEVIVVGYGTQRRKAVTGSVSKVDLKNLQNTPATNISQALRGSVAGVQFTSNGRPGQGGNILIRGQRSITASNDPLIVLDGIIFSGSLNDISPNDVESMEVLQDASAGAIYGTRAANGVILVTTKRGTTEKPTITFNTYYGVQDYAHKIKFHTPEQYIQTILDYRTQSGQASDPANVLDYLQPLERDNYTNGRTTDPYDLVSQDATIQSYELGVSGRTSRLSYYFSGGLTKDKGLVFNDKENRISFRTNLEAKVTDWFRTGITSQFTQRDRSGIEAGRPSDSDFEQGPGYGTSPYANYYLDEAKTQLRLGVVTPAITNPLFHASRNLNDDKNYNLFANIYGVVDIPFIKGLSYRINYSPNLRWDHQYTFEPIYLLENRRDSGIAKKFNSQTFDYYLENIVNYKKIFASAHSVDLTLLYGRNSSKFERTNARSERFFNDALGYNNLSLGRVQTTFSDAVETNGISSMARLNYGFTDKYFITLTARRDGFSAFGPNNKFGVFPTAAVAWIASDESFFKNNKILSYLKFRASYGKVGNQGIAAYSTVPRLSNTFPNNAQVAYIFGDGGRTAIGLYPSNIVNNDLKWETTITLNTALDFEVLKGKIGGTVEVYNSDTKDLLLDQSISPITGFSSLRTNIGATNNKGVNVTLNTVNINSGKLRWTTNLASLQTKTKLLA